MTATRSALADAIRSAYPLPPEIAILRRITATRSALADAIRSAIRSAYPLPPEIAILRRIATMDLWHGPIDPESLDDDEQAVWLGFTDACQRMRNWLESDVPSCLYWDADAEHLSDSEPEAWTDDETGETFEPAPFWLVEHRTIKAALFPRNLHEYV